MTEAGVDAEELHRHSLVVDMHVHAPRFVPQPARALYRLANATTMPREVELAELPAAGVDAAVVKAVGDPWLTRMASVDTQLDQAEHDAARAGAIVATTPHAIRAAHAAGHPAIVLGVEGADAAGRDLGVLDRWHGRGVRVVVLVHLGDNAFGSTCLPWQRYVGPLPVRRRAEPGLTALGRRAVGRLQELGVLVDLAHSDTPTLMAAVDAATAPVVSTHTGARARSDFARFLADDELRAIASTGGVVGLWPYCHRGRGVSDMADLVGHARHVADLVGPAHLGIGTDMNGVPGLMTGYRGEGDLPLVTAALLGGGFTAAEVEGILGGNAMRVFEAVSRG